jgi:hypothetical protein
MKIEYERGIIVAHPELVKAIRELLAKHMQESE